MANPSRRDFMRHSLLGLAALPLGIGVLSTRSFAQDLSPLDPESDQAKALNYVETAAEASDHPAYAEGETCANCMFYQADSQGCQLFPQNSVAPEGWCQSWTAKA
ncbi:High-potential iron-sulfur protein [Halomonas sp. THAF12]|uniref:high-potential iron-sulfur protein n=1 Tax=Halomonas sp. THAF12 TaxID=2587849 RepID=UPI00126910D9|nr:high-potential iron-sulfur protein [Halomonas sp. THAF12]QFT86064.1 High-potential iron-sulfur protein [Halomonas sp. THAF12]